MRLKRDDGMNATVGSVVCRNFLMEVDVGAIGSTFVRACSFQDCNRGIIARTFYGERGNSALLWYPSMIV